MGGDPLWLDDAHTQWLPVNERCFTHRCELVDTHCRLAQQMRDFPMTIYTWFATEFPGWATVRKDSHDSV